MRSERADGCAVSGPVRGGSEARSAGAAARVARHALPAWCLLVAAAVASGGMPATGAPPLVLTDQAAVVSESPATASVRPRIAVTADGAVHVVWQEDTADASIVMHRYRSPGGTWSTPVEVFWGAAQPAIATDGSTVVVAFVRMPFDRTDHTEVLWNSWDARARSWQDEAIAIEGDLGLDGSQPAAAIDGPGGFLWLVWASSRRAENVPYYARIRLATGEVDTADVIQRYEEGAQGPVVSIDGEGVVYAAWSATYPSGEAEIVLWRYATGVGYWTPVDTAGYDQLRQARSPSVAVGAGVVCLAWHEGTVDQPNEVVLSCDRAGGSVWLGNASHSPAVRSLAPSIAFDDRRGPLLAWRERSSPPPEHLLFTQGLPPATEPARVTDGSASPVDSPALTFHGSHVYAAWVEATSEGASDVRFARWPVELPTATPTATRQPVRTATSTPTPTATGSPSVTPTGTPPTATPSPTGTRHIGWVFLPFATMP